MDSLTINDFVALAEARGFTASVSRSITTAGRSTYIRFGKGGVGGEARISDHSTGELRWFDYQFHAEVPLTTEDFARWRAVLDRCEAAAAAPKPSEKDRLTAELEAEQRLLESKIGSINARARRLHRRRIAGIKQRMNERVPRE